MYIEVQFNPQFIEPIDEYTEEEFIYWCELKAEQLNLVDSLKLTVDPKEKRKIADRMLHNASKMLELQHKYEI